MTILALVNIKVQMLQPGGPWMKRQSEWEDCWQGGVEVQAAPLDRWAPWVALLAGLVVAVLGQL